MSSGRENVKKEKKIRYCVSVHLKFPTKALSRKFTNISDESLNFYRESTIVKSCVEKTLEDIKDLPDEIIVKVIMQV